MCLYCDVDTQPRFCFVLLQGASVSKSTPLQKRGKVFKEPQSEASKIKKSLLVSRLNTIILIVCVIRSFSTTAIVYTVADTDQGLSPVPGLGHAPGHPPLATAGGEDTGTTGMLSPDHVLAPFPGEGCNHS